MMMILMMMVLMMIRGIDEGIKFVLRIKEQVTHLNLLEYDDDDEDDDDDPRNL